MKDYISRYRARFQAELSWYGEKQPLRSSLVRIANARDASGKRHPHQWRILKSVSPQALAALSAVEHRLKAAKTFSELHGEVLSALKSVRGSGSLFVYDTALRLGKRLDLFPTEIYIHAGVREGARRALNRPLKPTEPVAAFPAAFHGLAAHELENLLCCYRECVQSAA